SCRSTRSSPSAARSCAALRARSRAPIPWSWRSPTASRCGPVCRRGRSWNNGPKWSGQQDLNLRPAVPKTAALPGCAIPRRSRLWIHRSPTASKPRNPPPTRRSVAFAEDRAGPPVARLDAELARRPADHFEHRAHRRAGWDEAVGFRLGVLLDAGDAAVAADEHHVQGNVGIVHPERDRLVMLEVEQHALAFR